MRSTCARMVLACAAVVVLAATGWAQQDKDKDKDRDGGHRHRPQAPADAAVDFGVLPLTPASGRRRASRPAASAVPPIRARICCTT